MFPEERRQDRIRLVYMGIVAGILALGLFLLPHKVDRSPIPPRLSFTQFPRVIGHWEGTPIVIPAKEQAILNADDDIMFQYDRVGERIPSLSFYTAYYRHQTPDKTIHSPKNCLPGSGWAIINKRDFDLVVSGQSFQVTQAVIQKGLDEQVVLYWYQERGHAFSNEYLARWYLLKDALMLHRTDGALIRISMPLMKGSIRQTVRQEIGFVRNLVPYLDKFIPGKGARTATVAENGLTREMHHVKQ